MATLRFSPFLSISSSSSSSPFPLYPSLLSSRQFSPFKRLHLHRSLSISRSRFLSFALAESDSAKSLEENSIQPLLQELSDCLKLPPDFLSSLPNDLRLDLNDAAFDLSNGPVLDECGDEVGDMLLNLSRAWERADTSTSNSIAEKLPSIESSLKGRAKLALGKRLVSAGRRFQAMGQYGNGEVQKIANSMIKTGKELSKTPVIVTDEEPDRNSKKLKFGEIEFELTPEKANIGAAVGVLFGVLSWALTRGVQSIPESSMEYANDNALMLAKSLRGALLVLCYSSTFLSGFTSIGLLLLGRQLSNGNKPE
ncbi:hypothetical protein LUZ63_009071 [Rhynchospora breviuscula]|uniref:LOW protein: ammonium transporter 1-like protein n=1 Tax=Rhynchospora breviuscula TaxID=2022672 RepID=A0A9Q0CEE7_9POAL|nr:hypothetical protein LUZ63_009071 [Rhynchospora breviuscula]